MNIEKLKELVKDSIEFVEPFDYKNLNETELFIGDTFEIGEAIIQISEPRMPCYKLGIRFKTPKIIKEFTLLLINMVLFRKLVTYSKIN